MTQRPQPKVCRVSGGADGSGRLLRRHQTTLQRRRCRPGGGDGLVPLSSPAAGRALVEPEPAQDSFSSKVHKQRIYSHKPSTQRQLSVRRGCCWRRRRAGSGSVTHHALQQEEQSPKKYKHPKMLKKKINKKILFVKHKSIKKRKCSFLIVPFCF